MRHTPDTYRPGAYAHCPKCHGALPNHGLVHVRHGNGGGHNEPCPLDDREDGR